MKAELLMRFEMAFTRLFSLSKVQKIGGLAALLLTFTAGAATRPQPQIGPESAGGPTVSFDGTKISASGATRGDTVYGAGVEIRGGEYAVRIETHSAAAQAGADGTALLDMDKRITMRSIWLVADANGYTVSPGPNMVRRSMDLPGAGTVTEHDGQIRHLAFHRYSVYVFLVRPNTGIWSARMMDGHVNDDDKAINGAVAGSLSSLLPVAGTTAQVPDHLLPGDVLFVVDPYSLEYAVERQGR